MAFVMAEEDKLLKGKALEASPQTESQLLDTALTKDLNTWDKLLQTEAKGRRHNHQAGQK